MCVRLLEDYPVCICFVSSKKLFLMILFVQLVSIWLQKQIRRSHNAVHNDWHDVFMYLVSQIK